MYWSTKLGETCSAAALLSKLPLTLSSGSQRRRVDVEPEQIADGVRVLAAVEAAQRHASGLRLSTRRGVDLVLEPRDELGGRLARPGACAPAGGIRPPRSLRITFSAISALWSHGRVEIQRRQRQAARSSPGRCGSPCRIPIHQSLLGGNRGDGRGLSLGALRPADCPRHLRTGGRRSSRLRFASFVSCLSHYRPSRLKSKGGSSVEVTTHAAEAF